MSGASSSAPSSSRRVDVLAGGRRRAPGPGRSASRDDPPQMALTGTPSRMASSAISNIDGPESSMPSNPKLECRGVSLAERRTGDEPRLHAEPDPGGHAHHIDAGCSPQHGCAKGADGPLAGPRRPTRGRPRARSTGRGRSPATRERRHEALPEQQVVAIADAAEDPRARADVAVVLEVEHAVDAPRCARRRRVLGVDVEDRRPSARIASTGSMPCQKRCDGSRLAPTVSPISVAQAEQRLRVVDDEARVHLEAEAHAVLASRSPRPRASTAGRPRPTARSRSRRTRAATRRSTQFGWVAAGRRPGIPRSSSRGRRPSSAARPNRVAVDGVVMRARARASGCSGLPWQLSALMTRSRASKARRETARAPSGRRAARRAGSGASPG